jgi:formamidopyrimidine-DNA glycosylase
MTGLVLLADPPNRQHLRVEFELDREPCRLWYWDRRGLGSVRLFTAEQLEQAYGPSVLGPDALSITLAELKLLKKSQRAVKAALLDQRAVAGIGNIYASEMLHLARIHPAKPCSQISVPAWKRLHGAMLEVLAEAIRYEGSTLGDGTYRNALNKEGGYQHEHRVYARADQVCRSCGRGTISRIVLQQRATFFCPRCQRL